MDHTEAADLEADIFTDTDTKKMDRKTYEIVSGPREKHPANTELINASGSELINADGPTAAQATAATEVTRNQAYKESGSKLPYKDWLNNALKSGELDSLKQQIADRLKNKFGQGGDSTNVNNPPPPPPTKPTYILGMRPFVAVFVGVAAISLLAFGAYKLVNRKNK